MKSMVRTLKYLLLVALHTPSPGAPPTVVAELAEGLARAHHARVDHETPEEEEEPS